MRATLCTLLSLTALAACSDYSLSGAEKAEPGTGTDGATPDIAATPELISTVVCVEAQDGLTVQNVGGGVLTVSGLSVSGSGWSVSGPATPFKLAAGESSLLELTATGPGAAELLIESDDPDEPILSVPLDASADGAPTVTILTPSANDVIDIGVDLDMEGLVSDEEDPVEDLTYEWRSDVDGLIASGAALADGSVDEIWPAIARSEGDHDLSLSVTDSCGNTTTTDLGLCQQAGYDVDALDISSWHFEGSSTWDTANDWLQLTDTSTYQVGSAFNTSASVGADNVQIEFAFYIGGGSGADGLSLTALDVDRMSTFLGGSGCGIGYGGNAQDGCTAGPALPGWTIEVDTYFNTNDPTQDDHIHFTFDGDVDDPAIWAALPEMEDTGWHQMSVQVVAPHVTVSIDGVAYIDADLSGNFAFPAYVGFTAGTGGETNYHLIDALQVTEYTCE